MLSRSFRYQAGTAVALALLANASVGAAPTPIVDTKSTSTSSGVSREMLDSLPTGRRLEDLIRTCPGNTIPTVSRPPQSLTGSQSAPNYMIDGVPVVEINCIQPADIEMVEVYKVHNSLRAEYGAPPLVWDPVLIQGPYGAQSHANALATGGRLFHSSREGRGTVRENIGQGLAGASVGQMLGGWTNEKKNFIPGTFPNVSRTYNWFDIGHIAQMLWVSTVMIGCAKAAGIGSWLVCRYDPGGNKDGQVVGIPPPKTQQVATRIEQPTFPKTETFDQVPRASLFDLGIYGGGAWTSDWFDIGDAQPGGPTTDLSAASPLIADILTRNDESTTVNNIIAADHDYGFDSALFVGYDLGAFRLEAEVAYKQADIEDIETVVRPPSETPKQAVSNDDGMMGRRASLFDLGIYAGGAYHTDWFDIPDAGAPEEESVWLQDRVRFGDYFSLNLGVRADAYDSGPAPSGSFLDFGFSEDPVGTSWLGYRYVPGALDTVPYSYNIQPTPADSSPTLDSPYLQDTLTSGNLTVNMGLRYDAVDGSPPAENVFDFGFPHSQYAMGYEFDFKKAINEAVLREFYGQDSYALELGRSKASFTDVPVETWGEFSPGVDLSKFFTVSTVGDQVPSEQFTDTKVEQPDLSSKGEVFNPNAPKVATSNAATSNLSTVGKQEPSNPYQSCGGGPHFWDAEKTYKEAKAKGDADGMATAKKQMLDAIERQWQAADAAGSVGEFASISTYSLGDFLGKMMDSYRETTGEIPPKYYEPPSGFTLEDEKPLDTRVQQPELQTKEVFNPADAPNCPSDVM